LLAQQIYEKTSRTPLIIPRIIDHSKDVDPQLDQSNPLTVKPMDLEAASLDVPEPVAGAPEITRTGVCSNSSPIKHQHPKPNHASGGEVESYRFSAWVHKQRVYMPMAARTIEGKIRTSYRPKSTLDGKITKMVFLCTLFPQGAQWLEKN
jgi:hypothetical protein